jgi:methionyl-tRNA synthetase
MEEQQGQTAQAPEATPLPKEKAKAKPTITYDDFAKLDLRVAKILDAEPVEGSDKLLKLRIRVGTEERTLVAGIAQNYAPDEILGKKIIIVANLEPRKIRGIESQGMLLAAAKEKDGKLVGPCLATVDDLEFPDGAPLS